MKKMTTTATSSSSSYSSIEYPPGPHSILPNKLLREFIHTPIKTLMDIAYTYGDISHFKFGRQHVYLINNPHYIEDILIRKHKNFIKSRGLRVSKRQYFAVFSVIVSVLVFGLWSNIEVYAQQTSSNSSAPLASPQQHVPKIKITSPIKGQ